VRKRKKNKNPLNAQEHQLYDVLRNYKIYDINLDLTVREWREKKLKEFRERDEL
jgi:hypothetical protein